MVDLHCDSWFSFEAISDALWNDIPCTFSICSFLDKASSLISKEQRILKNFYKLGCISVTNHGFIMRFLTSFCPPLGLEISATSSIADCASSTTPVENWLLHIAKCILNLALLLYRLWQKPHSIGWWVKPWPAWKSAILTESTSRGLASAIAISWNSFRWRSTALLSDTSRRQILLKESF